MPTPDKPTLSDYINAELDKLYKQYAEPMLLQVNNLSMSRTGKMQTSLKKLDEEADRLVEADKRMEPDNAQLEQTINDYQSTLDTTSTLIQANDNQVQNSAMKFAITGLTAGVFIYAASKLMQAGKSPVTPAAMKFYEAAIEKAGLKWNKNITMDMVKNYVDSPEWITKMDKWGVGYANVTRDTIVKYIGQGAGPKAIASKIRQHAENIPKAAADSLMRTLQNTSYRDASVAMEKINGGAIEYKIRIAKLDNRTCLACIGLHGTRLEPGERVDDHYRGRCSEIYKIPGVPLPEQMQADSEPGNRKYVKFQTGEEWFASLPPERQAQQASFMKSPAKLRAYRDGTKLIDFVGDREDEVFGNQKIEKSLIGILGDDAKSYYGQPPSKPPSYTPTKTKVQKTEKIFVAKPAETQQSLEDFENSIYKNNFETAGVYTQDGKLLFTKKGEQSSVRFTIDELNQMNGNILTHNHPRGTSFSRDDIKLLISEKAKEIRAVSEEYAHSMINDRAIKITNKRVDSLYNKSLRQAIIDNPSASDKDLLSKAWDIFAKEAGLKYERIAR